MIGIAVKTTLDGSQTVQYTALISGITKQVSLKVYVHVNCFLLFTLFEIIPGEVHGPEH